MTANEPPFICPICHGLGDPYACEGHIGPHEADEPPSISLDDYCPECNVDHALHPHPNADPHEPWECRAAEAKADRG